MALSVSIINGLFIPPYVLKTIGVDGYSLWVIVVAFASYVQILDFGALNALTKHITESRLAKNYRAVEEYLGSFVTLSFCGTICIAALLYAFGPVLVLNVLSDSAYSVDLRSLIMGFAVIAAFNLNTSLFSCLVKASQRMDVQNLISITGMMLNVAFVVVFLQSGFGIFGVLYAAAISAALNFFLVIIFVRKNYRELRFRNFLVLKISKIKDVLVLGSPDQIGRIFSTIWGPMAKFLVVNFAGSSFLVAYDLGMRLVNQVNNIPGIMFNSLLPAVVELSMGKEEPKLIKLLRYSTQYLALLGMPLILFVLIFSEGLVSVWLSGVNPDVVLTIRILLIGNFCNLLTGPLYHAAIGLGAPRLGLQKILVHFIALISLIATTIWLNWGYYGIVLSESISIFISAVYFVRRSETTLAFTLSDAVKLVFKKTVTISISVISVFGVVYGGFYIFGGHFQGILSWGAFFAVFYTISLCCYYFFGLIGEYETLLVRTALVRRAV